MKKESLILFSVLLLFCVSISDIGSIGVNAANTGSLTVQILGPTLTNKSAKDVLDVIEIPSNGNFVTANFNLQSGSTYEIVVSGVYYTGGTPIAQFAHDAKSSTNDYWEKNHNDTVTSGLYMNITQGAETKPWGAYNSEHIYTHTITVGGDKPVQISFSIHDAESKNNTADNTDTSSSSSNSSSDNNEDNSNKDENSTSISASPANNSPTASPPDSTNPATGPSDSPFGNTFVIITTLVVIIAVAMIILFARSKNNNPKQNAPQM